MKRHAPVTARPGPRRATVARPATVRSARRFLPWLVALGLIAAGAFAVSWLVRPRERPNVLLITIDTLRADHVGAYRKGVGEIATPILDALAARGTLFVDAVCQVPLTLPSHASILTGLTPPAHGIRDNFGFVLGPNVRTLAEQFRDSGYATGAFVSGYPLHHRFGLNRGFDVYDDRFAHGDDPARPPYTERRADATVQAASAWVRTRQAPGRPFFAWVHLFDPHAPYEPPEPFRTRFRDNPYDGEIAFADSQIGVLFEDLARAGLLSKTVVLLLADHGEGLGEHGEPTHGLFIYDSTIRIPLMVAGPGIRSGIRATALARAIDVGPTLLDLTGLPALPGAEGRSLARAAQGRELPPEGAYVESLFARLSFGWAPLYGWRSAGTMFIDAPRPEMYDIGADPAQLHDVSAARPADTARYRRLAQAVAAKAAVAQPASIGVDARERLRSLGYTGGAGTIAHPSLRDPKDFASLAVRIEKATTIERTDPEAAAREFRAALTEEPANPLARRHLAIALSNLRRFDEALAEARQLVAAGDTSADTLAFVGECYRLGGHPDEALEAFREAANRDPQMTDPIDGRGKTLVAMGRRDEARSAFTASLAIAPDDPDALIGLADLAIERGDLAEARARLETLHASEGSQASTDLKLGIVLVRQGEIEQAIALFRQVAASEPANVDALVDLGGALAKAGRAAEAVPYFERAVAAGVENPVVWNSLGVARLESGNNPGAIDALHHSLRVKPGQPDIVAMLQKLEGRR
jgi:choline-sulfatase